MLIRTEVIKGYNNLQLCIPTKNLDYLGETYYLKKVSTQCVMETTCSQMSKCACETHEKITADVAPGQRVTSTSTRQGQEKNETIVKQGILKPVQPDGVKNAYPLIWYRMKKGAERLCVKLKVHINGRKWTMTIQYQAYIPNTKISIGPLALRILTYQTHIFKRNWTRMQKNTHSQHIARIIQDLQYSPGLDEVFCHLPVMHGVHAQRNQGCGHFLR